MWYNLKMLKIIFILVLVFSFWLTPLCAAQIPKKGLPSQKVPTFSISPKKVKQKPATKKQVKVKPRKTKNTQIQEKESPDPKTQSEKPEQKPVSQGTKENEQQKVLRTPVPVEDTKEKLRKLQETLKSIKKIEPVKIKPIEPSIPYSPQIQTPQLRADPLLPYYDNLSPF